MKRQLILTASLLALTTFCFAQSKNSVNEQFSNLIQESSNYQTFKVVKKDKLELLQRNVASSIEELKNEIDLNNAEVLKQKASVEQLSTELQKVELELQDALARENNLEVFGIATNKGTFLNLIGAIIAILFSSLVVLFLRFKKSHAHTKDALSKLDETENELEDLRRLSLEREQKIRRQLQDEINKNKPKCAS
ncbi:hypothetical protein ACYSNM_04440 [Myroides sp. LJL116]